VSRLGFVKAGSTMDETMENIKRAEVEKEIKEKKERKRFIENKDAPLDHL
jgi:predicted lipid-binding transport protein (Tim44 family)